MSSAQKVKPSGKITHKLFQVPYEVGTTVESVANDLTEKGANLWEAFLALNEFDKVSCECLLNSSDILIDLKGFDLLVHDSSAICFVLLAEYLDIKRVEIISGTPNTPLSVKHMIPMPVSYIPQAYTLPGYAMTDKMTFKQRVVNLGMYIGGLFGLAVQYRTMNSIKYKYNIKPERSFQEASGDAELVLITADFALEYPQPLLPGKE